MTDLRIIDYDEFDFRLAESNIPKQYLKEIGEIFHKSLKGVYLKK